MGIKVGEEDGDWEDIVDGKEVNASVRVEVHLVNAKSALVYLTVIPLSLDEMKEKAEKWEVDIHSDRWPMAILPTGVEQAAKRGAIQAKLMVVEAADVGAGLGLLPLIEQVSLLTIKFRIQDQ